MDPSPSISIKDGHTETSAHRGTVWQTGDNYHGPIVCQGGVTIIGGREHHIILPQGISLTHPTMSSQPELPEVNFHISNSTFNNDQGDQFNVINNRTQVDCRHTIRQWLQVPDPSSNHKAACLKRQPNTGNWFIKGNTFANWKANLNSSQFICLYGRPGCGKTILSSTIICDVLEHCEANPPFAIAYFYFDFQNREKQTCQNFLCSLIGQLAEQFTSTPEALERLHSKCQSTRGQPDLDDLAITLRQLLAEFKQTFIVADALDECTEREQLLKLIGDIVTWKISTVHLLMTSRLEREIEDYLASRVSHAIVIEESLIAGDIEIHIKERLTNDPKLRKWSATVQTEIKKVLMQDARGMFRWVSCQLDELRKCAKLSELKKALKSLPETLDSTYERILNNIDTLYQDDVYRVLQWLCFSLRPLEIREIVDALAVTFEGGPKFDPDERYVDARDILTRCSSLVSVTSTWNGDILGLAHFSVKEYLLSDRIRNGTAHFYAVIKDPSHRLITQTCLAYLLQFKTVACPKSRTIGHYPLALYAAHYWVEHFHSQNDTDSDSSMVMVMELFGCSVKPYSPQYVTWAKFHDLDWEKGRWRFRPDDAIPSPLCLASLARMLPVVQAIIQNQDNVNTQEGGYGCPLQAASYGGHEMIVKLLLRHGADVNAKGGKYGTPLMAASCAGHGAIVKLLLEHGANVNIQEEKYGTPLLAATHDGHQDIVKLLLQHGANVNVSKKYCGSPLQMASYYGHEVIAKLLLQHSADVNAEEGAFSAPLQAASYGCHEKTVELLLQHGANANARGGQYGSALHAALYWNNEAIMKLLLQHGADVNSTLQEASYRDHRAIVKLLLQHGADVNTQQGEYGTALQAASSCGHVGMVKLLLHHGAKVNIQGGEYNTALQAASYSGHEAIVELLLQHDANINAQGGEHNCPLQAASYRGQKAIVELLMERGANVNAQGGRYGSPLQAALYGHAQADIKLLLQCNAERKAQGAKGQAPFQSQGPSYETIIELLVKHGADVNAQGGEHGTPLQAASFFGHETSVQLLLQHGADVNAHGGRYGTSLQAASYSGQEVIVQLLLQHDADVDAQTGRYGCPLQAASYRNHEAIVKLLIQHGADINAQGGRYHSPLQAASFAGHEIIVKLLLQHWADPHTRRAVVGKALQAALQGGRLAVVKLLLKQYAES